MKVGDVFYACKGPGKPYKCYVMAIVDEDYVVYKWYGRHKQWWHYQVEWGGMIDMYTSRAKRRNEDLLSR